MEAIVAAVIGAIGTILSAVVLIRPRWGGVRRQRTHQE